jgi:hypothetical protein
VKKRASRISEEASVCGAEIDKKGFVPLPFVSKNSFGDRPEPLVVKSLVRGNANPNARLPDAVEELRKTGLRESEKGRNETPWGWRMRGAPTSDEVAETRQIGVGEARTRTPGLRALFALTGFAGEFHRKGARLFCHAPRWMRVETDPSVVLNFDESLYDFGSGVGGQPAQWYLDFLGIPRSLSPADPRVRRALRHFFMVAQGRGHHWVKDLSGGSQKPRVAHRRSPSLEQTVVPGSPIFERAQAWSVILKFATSPTPALLESLARRAICPDTVKRLFEEGRVCHFGTVRQLHRKLRDHAEGDVAIRILESAGLGHSRGALGFVPAFDDDCYWLITRYFHPILQVDLPIAARRRRIDMTHLSSGAKELALPNVFTSDPLGLPATPLYNHTSASLWSRCSTDSVYLTESPLDCVALQVILNEWVENARDAQARTAREIARSKITILGAYGAGAVKEEWCREVSEARKVFICMDDDEAGHAAAERWRATLNRLRVPCERLESFPVDGVHRKDPNDALLGVHASSHPLLALDRLARVLRFEEVLHD